MRWRVRPSTVRGTATVPGDKSIGHRSLMFAALARGRSEIRSLPDGEDVQSTARCLQALGTHIRREDDLTIVEASGRLERPTSVLDCGNSGTSMRLLCGVLAGQPFRSCLVGDASLSRRPMQRVIEPLQHMGARIAADNGHAPLDITGSDLRGIDYELPVASAQVKSAVLLGGLFATGTTTVRERASRGRSRNHTEIMMRALGIDVDVAEPRHGEAGAWSASVAGGQRPHTFTVRVPGDPSSAAFLFAAASLTNGDITVPNLLMNPTRRGFLDALESMETAVLEAPKAAALGEAIADVTVCHRAEGELKLAREGVPGAIDEIPLLVLLATQLDSITRIHGVSELRIKETDRIHAVAEGLNALGARIEELPDGFFIHGPTPLRGTTVGSYGDHRIGMMLAVAGLIAEGETIVEGAEAAAISWPQFAETLRSLGGDIAVL